MSQYLKMSVGSSKQIILEHRNIYIIRLYWHLQHKTQIISKIIGGRYSNIPLTTAAFFWRIQRNAHVYFDVKMSVF